MQFNCKKSIKVIFIREGKNPTLFFGDGINDAPALKVATVGTAFGQISAVTKEAGGAVVMENTFEKIDELLHISIDMRKNSTTERYWRNGSLLEWVLQLLVIFHL